MVPVLLLEKEFPTWNTICRLLAHSHSCKAACYVCLMLTVSNMASQARTFQTLEPFTDDGPCHGPCAGETDWDLAVTQFTQNCGHKILMNIKMFKLVFINEIILKLSILYILLSKIITLQNIINIGSCGNPERVSDDSELGWTKIGIGHLTGQEAALGRTGWADREGRAGR
jgi:hypothetical protein